MSKRNPNVEEQPDGTVSVGKPPVEQAKDREANAANQQDRIEAKLDRIVALLEE